jgi:hypothetical protein
MQRRNFSDSDFSMRLLAAVVATVVAAAVLSGMLWLFPTSYRYPPDAPISYATVRKVHYLSNFCLYIGAVLICVPAGIAFFRLFPQRLRRAQFQENRARRAVVFSALLSKKIASRFRQDVGEHSPGSASIASTKRLLVAVATVLVVIVGFTSQCFYSISGSLLRIREPFTATLTDTFHEGELLAPIPSMRSGVSTPKPFLAHGPGMDLLPGLLAIHFFPAGHHIVGTRIGAALLTLGSFGCFLFASCQVLSFIRPGRTMTDLFLCLSGLLLILVSYDYLCRGSPRRLILFLQLGMVFRLLRWRSISTTRGLFVSVLIGVSFPIGFIYNYAIGIAGMLFGVASISLICMRQTALSRTKHLAAISAGVLIGGFGSYTLLGSAWISTISSNMSYWSRFGQVLTFTPMFRREWLARPEWYVYSLLLIVPPALTAELIVVDYLNCRNLRRTLERRTAEVLLLVICLVESRTFLERADFQHFGFGAPVFVLTYAILAVILAEGTAALFFRSWKPWSRVCLPAAALALAAIVEYPNLRPDAVVHKAYDLLASINTPDSRLLRADYAEAVASMKDHVSRQICFYTLNSEGAWYDLLDMPSCSAFAQLNYARTPEGQTRVLSDLRKFRPPIILVNSDRRDGGYDEIALEKHSQAVWEYIAATYQPFRTVAGFRFYKLRQ